MGAVQKIAVIGAGTMGRQIGMAVAVAGFTAVVQDVSSAAVADADTDMRSWLDGRVTKERMTQSDAEAAGDRIRFTTDLADAVGDADLVIEAATEKLEVKRSIFAQIGELAPPHAVLATNSSTYGSSEVAAASGRPAQVCNMHFFNPALVMKAVEVVRHSGTGTDGTATSDDTVATAVAVVEAMGKRPVLLDKEVPGFVANRLLWAIRAEALDLVADGVASYEDVDAAAKAALGHPMGPFELMDLVGIDVIHDIRQAAHEITGDEKDRPHPLIAEKYAAGDYGRKTGRGWYSYE
ncbi:MAG TPA: 3-hydroxyacyl-CoA dehydrogenase family protein [Candidatus Corynebacterium avicola]|uniref:3-hydroxyacyl-CoA dehydrogenase family protein n=1 Tax=Candidatus Corynebacterium avicola TaxID=2838527 RepID=A0A9D1RP39_9CORY|nr:3-hydroxyacyl-CoA dehydrogenase family protein [Candidatus Corynebacterium avicola]